jgi:hypothetical protein
MGARPFFDRRTVLGWVAAGPAVLAGRAWADVQPAMVVFRDPTCGCCHHWVEHLTANGFAVTVHDAPDMKPIKARFGVPTDLSSCHTGEIGGYVIEGHVPAVAIRRLLAEKPAGRGLAVPGMPIGSPGMEGGEPEIYEVMLFGDGAPQSFGRFREDKPM